MAILQSIPAVIKVMVVFVFVLMAIRKKLSLGNAFMIGAGFIGLIFGMELKEMLQSFVSSILSPKTLSLAVVVSLILVLSNTMETVGQMKRLLMRFRGLISRPILNLAMFPALIGLLPMPGGAVFSAPMVKELGTAMQMTAEKMSFINYWYRHIWEYWWPLYPGVLLATALAGLNLWSFVFTMLPFTVMAALLGYLSIRDINGRVRKGQVQGNVKPPLTPFLRELSPILFVIVFGLGMGILLSWMFPGWTVSKEIGLITALLMAIAWIWHENHWPKTDILKILTNPGLLNMMYMVIAILVFKGMLEDCHAVAIISQEFKALHVPLLGLTILLPFLVNLVTGITIAFVGSTFPILILLIQSYGEDPFMMSYVMLAMASGFISGLFSPLHLCFILTNQYFSCSLHRAYRLLWLPSLLLFAFGLGYFYLLRYFLG